MRRSVIRGLLAVATSVSLPCGAARASEGGSDTIGKGSEGFFAGALPERPGLYAVVYFNDYQADRFKDGEGRRSAPQFDLKARVAVGRLFYLTPLKLAGGKLGFFAIASLASLRLRSGTGFSRHDGIGDPTVGSVLGWQIGDFHPAIATDFVLPVGDYVDTRALNAGNNHYAVRPILSLSYLPKSGFELSAKVTYTLNTRNMATDYTSGNLLHADYSASYQATSKLRLGINGYFLMQTTDDRQFGQIVNADGNRGRVHALGPALHYNIGKTGLDLKALKEFGARNRAQGTSIWLKFVFPL